MPEVTRKLLGKTNLSLTVTLVQDINPSDRSLGHRVSILLTGWVLVSLGIVSVLRAGLGAGPLDVLNVGVASRLGVQVGTASWVTMGTIIAVAMILGARPGPATFVSTFFVGSLVNVFLDLILTPDSFAARLVLLCVGVAILYLGVCLSVVAGLGYSAVDMLMFALGGKGLSLRVARWGIELTAVTAGVLLGGTAGIATILIALSAGPSLVRLIPLVARLPLVAVNPARLRVS